MGTYILLTCDGLSAARTVWDDTEWIIYVHWVTQWEPCAASDGVAVSHSSQAKVTSNGASLPVDTLIGDRSAKCDGFV